MNIQRNLLSYEISDVSGYMHNVLHWLSSEQQIAYRISALVWRTLLAFAPAYLRELCCPIICPIGSRSLRSSDQGLLCLPFARTSIRQNRAFPVVGPSTWNGLPFELRLFPRTLSLSFEDCSF